MIHVHLTREIPKQWQKYYGGGCMMIDGKFGSGWRDKHTTLTPLGMVMDHVMVLFDRYKEDAVEVTIDKEFTTSGRQQKIVINNPNK